MANDEEPVRQDDETVEDPETIHASERTRVLIHELAVGLTRLGTRAQALKDEALASKPGQRLQEAAHVGAEKVHEARAAAREAAQRAAVTGRQAAAEARTRSGTVAAMATEALATARAMTLGFVTKAEHATEHTVERLGEMVDELGERARHAAATGKDFYADHREEILALLMTAAKVTAVIGVRRLTAPREDDEGLETKAGRQKAARRVTDTAALLGAVLAQVGTLLARQPSWLPMLRAMYERGEPNEQAVVGMLLGPALSADPDHAMDVVHEFLEGATTGGAADTIARRSLAPLLNEHPELVERVTPWFQAAAPYVRRAALVALSRFIADRKSRIGDILAASVVVLEDHDEEVRHALVRLFRSSDEVDPETTARVIARHLEGPDAPDHDQAQAFLEALPEDLAKRVGEARTDREA